MMFMFMACLPETFRSSCPASCRASTSSDPSQVVDGRVEPGHDGLKLHSRHVVVRPLAGAVAPERALLADRIRALEDPVLPGGEAGEDLRFHRLRPGEAQIGFKTGEAVRREAGALLEIDADLVV